MISANYTISEWNGMPFSCSAMKKTLKQPSLQSPFAPNKMYLKAFCLLVDQIGLILYSFL